MSANQPENYKQSGSLKRMGEAIGLCQVQDRYLEMIGDPPEDRGNRLCVSISDIHLTDGTVGFQNLSDDAWIDFYGVLSQQCMRYYIDELVLVLDGDIVDMIRSDKWAKNNIYPWERERADEFSAVVNAIIKDIVNKHNFFFKWLQNLETDLRRDIQDYERDDQEAGAKRIKQIEVKIVAMLGNHDKELFCNPQALKYFYEEGLGKKVADISEQERKALGRMYGDEQMFLDPNQAPYLPFYYGDTGFRFFTTHGQWRDKENSHHFKAKDGMPGWSAADGWQIETWQQLRFAPFLQPCFGDTVAAGVLSTFIFKVKTQLKEAKYEDPRLNSVIDELDLYRPTYAAVKRVLDEVSRMRSKKGRSETPHISEEKRMEAINILKDTLYECILNWLGWDFTYQSSPLWRRVAFKVVKYILELRKFLGRRLSIRAIYEFMRILELLNRKYKPGISLAKMRKFPSFMPAYRHYNFQIHGEGHTHQPVQEEPNIGCKRLTTYINFGTWRDQIIIRKGQGYRRRGVLRALFIRDILKHNKKTETDPSRTFDYFVQDDVRWADSKDAMNRSGRSEPKV